MHAVLLYAKPLPTGLCTNNCWQLCRSSSSRLHWYNSSKKKLKTLTFILYKKWFFCSFHLSPVSFVQVDNNGKRQPINFNLWDTAGQVLKQSLLSSLKLSPLILVPRFLSQRKWQTIHAHSSQEEYDSIRPLSYLGTVRPLIYYKRKKATNLL